MRFGRNITLWAIVIALSACSTGTPPLAVFEGATLPTRQPTPEDSARPSSPTMANTITGTGTVFPASDGGRIEIGDTVTGTLSDEAYAVAYTFDGQPGQSVDISLAGRGVMDTYLILIGPDGREIARNDDREGSSDAAMLGINLSEGGEYIVVATRWRQRYGVDTGDFNLTLDEAASGDATTPLTQLTSYGVSQTGSITNDNWFDAYTFAGTAGEMIDITLTNDGETLDLDGSLLLTDSFGNEIAFSQDQNPLNNVDPAIYDLKLPYTGYFTVIATRDRYHRGSSTGDYELIVDRAGTGDPSTRYAYPDANQTVTLLADEQGLWTYGLFVGDALGSDYNEVTTQSILTFYFPPLASDPTTATLDLTACDTGGVGFEAIESINVYAEQLEDRINALTPFQPTGSARLLTSLDSCDTVDITAVVRDLYTAGGGGRLQFRLTPQATLANEARDTVVFLNPRVTLKTD
jgi:hypothetical protein